MSKVKVAAFSVSLDGYAAGPDQSRENPLGKRGEELHKWIFPTKMFQKMYGKGEGTEETDNDFAEKSFENLGAWIMGRNMFGPIRVPRIRERQERMQDAFHQYNPLVRTDEWLMCLHLSVYLCR